MQPYLDLVKDILENGTSSKDRTGTGTKRTFIRQERYNLEENKLPLLTTRKLNFNTILTELLWFLKGDSKCNYLDEHKVKIWKEWTDPETNSIGPLYPTQLRRWPKTGIAYDNSRLPKDARPVTVFKNIDDYGTDIVVYEQEHDQIKNLIKGLKERPYSRRHVISYWNVPYLPDESISPIDNVKKGKMALCPCHTLLQFYVDNKNRLSCHLYMRSSDVMVGRPFNICQYAILTRMIAQVCEMSVHEFIITSGDTHIYNDHVENAKELITRQPYDGPTLIIDPSIKDIDDFKHEHFTLVNYKYHPVMKFSISV